MAGVRHRVPRLDRRQFAAAGGLEPIVVTGGGVSETLAKLEKTAQG